MSPFSLEQYMQLIAAICDGMYHSSYYDAQIITSYEEAIEYFLSRDESIECDDSLVFFKYNESTSLNLILSDFNNNFSDYDDIYFDLKDVQKFFNIQKPTYKDGTQIKIHDKVKIASKNLYWIYKHPCYYYEAEVLSTDSYYITIKINQIQLQKPHYMLEQI